jgi:hypothetical protein
MGTIHTSVAAVINFTDAITEREILSGAVRMVIKQDNKVVWKGGKSAVIIDKPSTDRLDISIKSGIYRNVDISVDIKRDGKPPIYNVWLTPTENYPFTKDMEIIRGEADKTVYMAKIQKIPTIKLIEDTDKGGDIKLWGLKGAILDKAILLRENDVSEIAVIASIKEKEDGSCGYYLKDKLKNTFHKGKVSVCQAVKVVPGKDGKYIMAFKGLTDNESIEIINM